jgi:hypothetical protein
LIKDTLDRSKKKIDTGNIIQKVMTTVTSLANMDTLTDTPIQSTQITTSAPPTPSRNATTDDDDCFWAPFRVMNLPMPITEPKKRVTKEYKRRRLNDCREKSKSCSQHYPVIHEQPQPQPQPQPQQLQPPQPQPPQQNEGQYENENEHENESEREHKHEPKKPIEPIEPIEDKPASLIKTDIIPPDVMTNIGTTEPPFWTYQEPLSAPARKILQSLLSFYTQAKLEELIVPRAIKTLGLAKQYLIPPQIEKEINDLSLRSLEWLITNYSKKNNLVLYNKDKRQEINIHLAYAKKLEFYRRMYFDFFCRYQRLYFVWPFVDKVTGETQDKVLVTTIGQLNFMKWADENLVLKYARENHKAIQADMEKTYALVNKEKRESKLKGEIRKRRELSQKPKNICTIYSLDTLVHDNLWNE